MKPFNSKNVCCGATGTFLTCLIIIFKTNSLPSWDGCVFFFFFLFFALGEHLYSFTRVCPSFSNTLVDLCWSWFAAIWQLSLVLKSHQTINIYFWTICQGVCRKHPLADSTAQNSQRFLIILQQQTHKKRATWQAKSKNDLIWHRLPGTLGLNTHLRLRSKEGHVCSGKLNTDRK